MSVTLTNGLLNVVFTHEPSTIIRSIARQIDTYNFADGTETVDDMRKTGDSLQMTFPRQTDIFTKANKINTMMDSGLAVTLSGMSDSNLITSYNITDFRTSMSHGYEDQYDIEISLERRYDRLA